MAKKKTKINRSPKTLEQLLDEKFAQPEVEKAMRQIMSDLAKT